MYTTNAFDLDWLQVPTTSNHEVGARLELPAGKWLVNARAGILVNDQQPWPSEAEAMLMVNGNNFDDIAYNLTNNTIDPISLMGVVDLPTSGAVELWFTGSGRDYKVGWLQMNAVPVGMIHTQSAR